MVAIFFVGQTIKDPGLLAQDLDEADRDSTDVAILAWVFVKEGQDWVQVPHKTALPGETILAIGAGAKVTAKVLGAIVDDPARADITRTDPWPPPPPPPPIVNSNKIEGIAAELKAAGWPKFG